MASAAGRLNHKTGPVPFSSLPFSSPGNPLESHMASAAGRLNHKTGPVPFSSLSRFLRPVFFAPTQRKALACPSLRFLSTRDYPEQQRPTRSQREEDEAAGRTSRDVTLRGLDPVKNVSKPDRPRNKTCSGDDLILTAVPESQTAELRAYAPLMTSMIAWVLMTIWVSSKRWKLWTSSSWLRRSMSKTLRKPLASPTPGLSWDISSRLAA